MDEHIRSYYPEIEPSYRVNHTSPDKILPLQIRRTRLLRHRGQRRPWRTSDTRRKRRQHMLQ